MQLLIKEFNKYYSLQTYNFDSYSILRAGLSSLVGLYKPWRLQHFQRRTIALEIGIQNAQLALGIINLSGFSREEIAEVILFPVIYLTGQVGMPYRM